MIFSADPSLSDPLFLQHRLPDRMAARLVADVTAGKLERKLPSERELAQRYGVGRNTVRAALHLLRANNTLNTRARLGTVVTRVPPSRETVQSAGVILPSSLGRLRPSVIWWIDEVRAKLQEAGITLSLHPCPAGYLAKPGRALPQLVSSTPHGCWLLVVAPLALQEWFATRRIPCVVTGTAYEGIEVPSIDLDHRATGRHAAGVLLAHGHRRVALILKRAFGAGDVETATGFREAVAQHGHGTRARVMYQDETPDGFRAALRMLLNEPEPPTGLVVANPHCYLAAISACTAWGLSVPRDISIISRDDDPFLQYVEPLPARYTWRPAQFAALVAARTVAVLRGEAGRQHMRLLPEYSEGGTVARAPGA